MSQLPVVPCLQGKGITRKEEIMRVFVTGATGALGRYLVPGLIAAGHEVTATTRTPGKVAQLREAGAEPVVLDGLDREAVIAAVLAAAPEVIVHEMTALAGMRSLRNPDKGFAVTNELRTRGTDNLLAAAVRAGTRRVIAQSYAGPGPDKRSGPLKTEADPPDLRPIRSAVEGPAAIAYVDKTVPLGAAEGVGWEQVSEVAVGGLGPAVRGGTCGTRGTALCVDLTEVARRG
jgi:NAD(P)H-binding